MRNGHARDHDHDAGHPPDSAPDNDDRLGRDVRDQDRDEAAPARDHDHDRDTDHDHDRAHDRDGGVPVEPDCQRAPGRW